MSAMKKFLGIAIGSYAVALVVYWISSPYIAIAIPADQFASRTFAAAA